MNTSSMTRESSFVIAAQVVSGEHVAVEQCPTAPASAVSVTCVQWIEWRDALTDRQQMCLDFIRERVATGLPPTMREIGKYMSIRSTNAVNDVLRALERKGYLERDRMRARALRVIETPPPPPPPTESCRVDIDLAALDRALAKLDDLGGWFPRLLAADYADALEELRLVLRGAA